jgi:PAS domain S-box-containing protein
MKKEKILLIDDEEANVRVLSMSLRADGYEVLSAYSGEEGLEVFKKESPRIILTDIKMPGMDGIEVLRHIKAGDPDAEVVIVTGHGDIDSAVEALHHGASDFINKPVRDEALAIALKRAHEKLDMRRQLKGYTEELESMVREMKRTTDFQNRLIQRSSDGIVATDKDWKIVVYSPGAERIFGYRKAEVIRKVDARHIYPPGVLKLFSRKGKQEGKIGQEIKIVSKTGEEIPVRFSGTKIFENRQMMGSVAFFRDLREIKRLQQELIHSERLAAVGQTVAGLAHYIKNILHGFKGGGYLMNIGLDKNDPVKLRTGFKMVQKNIERTSELVLDLLSYSRERKPEYQDCLPNRIVEEVCEILSATAAENDVEIEKDLSPEIGLVSMDPRTVHRTLMNLVLNAIEACMIDKAGKKRYRVALKTELREGNIIEFQVGDNGCGMTEEVKAKLFTSFFSTKESTGTGLGLLVTKKMIEEHGGRISVVSQPGEGTTFTVRLPFKEPVVHHESISGTKPSGKPEEEKRWEKG